MHACLNLTNDIFLSGFPSIIVCNSPPYVIHVSPVPLHLFYCHMNTVHILTFCSLKVHFNIILPFTSMSCAIMLHVFSARCMEMMLTCYIVKIKYLCFNWAPRHWIGGWVGPRAVLDAVVKRKIPSPHLESNPRIPIVQPIAQRYTDWAITALM
jgi:hypothetical protein